jgi:type I restriction enzyme S subunit
MSKWEIVNWEDVLTIKNGKNQKKVSNPSGKYPIYGSGGIMGRADDFLCHEGTTIIGRKGSINNPIYVNEKFWNVDTAFGLHPKSTLDNKFLYYFCTTYNFLKHNKATTLPSLTKADLLKIKIPLPPLPQQKKVANILDVADALRQNDKALIAKYDELTQALFLDMFGDPVSNPKGWEKKRVYQISKFLFAGGDVPKDNFSKELNEKYNVPIYSNGLGENALYGFTNINKVKEDSITMSARGTIGFPEIRKTPFFPIIRLIVITPFTEVVLLNYLKIALSFLEFKKGGSSIPQLTVPMIKDKEILIPPIDLQEQFAERVAVIEEQKAIAQKSLDKSEELFNSLLQKAFKVEL